MKKFEDILVNKTGLFPDCVAINSTGAATPDGSEYVAGTINNSNHGTLQAFMDYADDGTNIPALSGTPGVPDGVIEAAGASQILEALQKGNAVGPGMYVQRAINDTPAVWGDRVLELSEQGVLVASYPDLNNATWIGGNDAAQVAAKAAGEYFWRADDAIGTTPLAAGPYLMLPNENPTYKKTYLGDGTDFTVTGPAGWATVQAFAIPYQTSDGKWWLRFDVYGTFTSTASPSITFSGVTFSPQPSAFSLDGSTTTTVAISRTTPSSGQLAAQFTTAVTSASYNGDVPLTSKPTWADNPSFDWYITY